MAAFKVGKDGSWWESWALPYQEGRDASPEEEALMVKVVWEQDSYKDREKLKELLHGT